MGTRGQAGGAGAGLMVPMVGQRGAAVVGQWATVGFLQKFKDLVSGRPAADTSGSARPTAALDLREVSADWLIVGLGNPGAKYAATRHNVGYMAVDDLLAVDGKVLTACTGVPAQAAVVPIGDSTAVVMRSTTFMNTSGEAVGPAARALGLPPERVIVCHDELDLPLGTVRLRQGGSENGHNGLKSISEHLGSRDYLRVRIGISRPPKGTPVIDWVLGAVDSGPLLDAAITTAARACRLVATEGLAKAQNVIHSS